MRYTPFFTLCLVVLVSLSLSGQSNGIEFFHGTWAEALAKSKEQKRLIFVDAYAQWCGPCKQMAAKVFPEKQAGDFFNKHFINLKIDMEKAENEEFARKFPVSAYPTLMIIDESGKLVTREVGGKSLEALLEFGKKALGAGNKSADYTKKYDAGERDPQFIHDYIVELNKAGKPSLKIVNEYLRGAKPEHQDITDKIIFEGATEADSKVFDRMTEKAEQYRKLYNAELVDAKINNACEATLAKAIAFKSEELLQETKAKAGKHLPAAAAKEFQKKADLAYFSKTNNAEGYVKLQEAQEKTFFSEGKYAAIEVLVIDACKIFPAEPIVLTWAEQAMKKVIKAENEAEYYLTLQEVQQRSMKFEDALKTSKKGKNLAEKAKKTDLVNKFDFYIQAHEERI